MWEGPPLPSLITFPGNLCLVTTPVTLIKAAGRMEVTQSQAGCDGRGRRRQGAGLLSGFHLSWTHTHTAILQAAEPPRPAATPSVLRLQPPLSTPHGQPGQGRQPLLSILHIRNSRKPAA